MLVLPYPGSMITDTKSLRILLADDAPSVRQALRWLLEEVPGFVVVGDAADGETAVDLSHELLPDLVIVDLELPCKNGFRVIQHLKVKVPGVRVIVLSGHGDDATRRLALEMGTDGFVEKSDGWEALLAQIHQVMAG